MKPSHPVVPSESEPAAISTCLQWPRASELPRRPVSHTYAVLSFCNAGSVTIEQNGRWTLHEGDVMIVPAGSAHRAVAMDSPEIWGLALCAPCMVGQGDASVLDPFERVRDGAAAVVSIPVERRPFLRSLLEELRREVSSVEKHGFATQRSLFTLIVREVDRAAQWPSTSRDGGGLVAQVLRTIERRCLGPLTLEEVSAEVRRSPAHVTTSMRRATGRSVVQWIIAGRLAEARRLLLHTDERIEQIAERVGYADATHFIRLFRREHGVTPAAWRATSRPASRG